MTKILMTGGESGDPCVTRIFQTVEHNRHVLENSYSNKRRENELQYILECSNDNVATNRPMRSPTDNTLVLGDISESIKTITHGIHDILFQYH